MMGNFFTDVIQKDPRCGSMARIVDSALLEPITRNAVLAIVEDAKALGLPLIVFETFRSQARQSELFAKGATKLQTVGVHHYGLACDLVKSVAGEPSWKGDFSFLGKLAKQHGLIWGGDWGNPGKPTRFVDGVHVQRVTVARQKQLFAGTWYPEETYNPWA
jgi:D-alanyl-D-alanine carboxypeptidase